MFTPDGTATAGRNLTAGLRYYLSIGTRTRRHRRDGCDIMQDLHRQMIEAITEAATCPGAHGPGVEKALSPGFTVALSYEKHVLGCRISGTLACRINSMTAWQFSALLGEMVDAGVTCTGDGERFFAEMARGCRRPS